MAKRRDRPDAWARRAKREGYAARSVYKLEELDQRFRLLRPGGRVLDLGCYPGSWLTWAARRVGSKGSVVGLDRVQAPCPADHVTALVGNVFDVAVADLDPDGHGFDAVLSDMAPDTTGMKGTDQARSAALVERALELALEVLRPRGVFVAKVFQGPDVPALQARVKRAFERATLARPKAVRKESSELYLVGVGFLRSS